METALVTVRLGVLGVADIARRRVLPGCARTAGLEVVAIASRAADRAAEAAEEHGSAAVQGYEQLLERTDVDAVYVPLPAALHAEWAERALRSGRHVLVEKPVATGHGRVAELLALARGRGLVLMENVMFVHHRVHRTVRELVDAGLIGTPRSFAASFTVPRPAGQHVRFRADLAGGALWELGVYPVRAALHLLRRPLELVGAVRTGGPGETVDLAGSALLRTDTGVAAHLSFGIDHAYSCTYELVGSSGRIDLARAFVPPADHEPRVRLSDAAGSVREILVPPDDQVVRTLEAFVAAVHRRAEPDGTAETLAQADLLERISRVGVGAPSPDGEGTR